MNGYDVFDSNEMRWMHRLLEEYGTDGVIQLMFFALIHPDNLVEQCSWQQARALIQHTAASMTEEWAKNAPTEEDEEESEDVE